MSSVPAGIDRTMTPRDWAMLLALSVLWGGSFFFSGVALRDLPPVTLVALRVGLAALILNSVVVASGARLPRDVRVWIAFAIMGLLNNAIPFALIVWAQTHIASGLAAILNATTPLATVLIAHRFTTDERLSLNRLVGVMLGLAGVAVMIGLDALDGLGVDLLAQLAVLCAAISYACAGIYGRRFRTMAVAPMAAATGQITASAAMLLPVALIVDRPWLLPAPGPAACAAVLGIAALSTALGYLMYFRLLATAGATNLLLVTLLNPVSANLLGILVLGERLEPKHILGMALIGVGLMAIDGRLVRFRAAARPS